MGITIVVGMMATSVFVLKMMARFVFVLGMMVKYVFALGLIVMARHGVERTYVRLFLNFILVMVG